MTLWFTTCSPDCETGGHEKKLVSDCPTISRTTRVCGSAQKPSMRGFMGSAGRSDKCGNTCPEAIRNAGNAEAGRFTLTGSDGVCQSMTAPWTSNPGSSLDTGNQSALLAVGTLVGYAPAWSANPGFCVL